jgi:hypothetical protein
MKGYAIAPRMIVAIILVLGLCGLTSYLVYGLIQQKNQVQQPAAVITEAPVFQQTKVPAKPKQPTKVVQQVQPTQVQNQAEAPSAPSTVPNVPAVPNVSGNDQKSKCTPIDPATDKRPVLRVGFPSFGSYFTAIMVLATDCQEHPLAYRLELVPLRLTNPNNMDATGKELPLYAAEVDNNGNALIDPTTGQPLESGSEYDQFLKMQDGFLDVLFNTDNIIVKHPQTWVWVADIDQSSGADKTIAWKIGQQACPGKEIKKFNDLKGCSLGVMSGSTGQFQVLSFMMITAMQPTDIQINQKYSDNDKVVSGLNNREFDGIAAWTPAVARPLEGGDVIPLLDSSWLRNINDSIIVTRKANAEKSDMVLAFLGDWFKAMRWQVENPNNAWTAVADYAPQGISTSQWTYVTHTSPSSAYEDAKVWMEKQVAQADFDDNALLADNPEILYSRFASERNIWEWGGVAMDGPFDPKVVVETKYIKALEARADEFRPTSGELIDPTYTPVVQGLKAPSAEQLIELPTIAQFACSKVNFGAGEVTIDPGTQAYTDFMDCAKGLKQLLMVSDTMLLIDGSAACPTDFGWNAPLSKAFATQRALSIQSLLKKAGVPIERTQIHSQAGTCTPDDAQNNKDRWVHIDIKRNGG